MKATHTIEVKLHVMDNGLVGIYEGVVEIFLSTREKCMELINEALSKRVDVEEALNDLVYEGNGWTHSCDRAEFIHHRVWAGMDEVTAQEEWRAFLGSHF